MHCKEYEQGLLPKTTDKIAKVWDSSYSKEHIELRMKCKQFLIGTKVTIPNFLTFLAMHRFQN